MNIKKIIKILTLIILLIFCIILVDQNVTAVKENSTVNDNKNSVLTLDLNSDLVKNLYEKLDLDLVNNTCLNCLSNNNYKFIYFKNYEKSKILSDTEKLYLVFNSLYKKEIFEKVIDDEKNTEYLKISVDTVKEELTELFGDTNFDTFDNNYKISQTCGVTDYIYTGANYELEYTPCNTNNEYAKVRQVNSYKEDNYIYIVTEAFYAATETKKEIDPEKDIFKIQNFNKDEVLEKTSFNKLNTDTQEIFDTYSIDRYTFRFELKGDIYYLKDIFKENNI